MVLLYLDHLSVFYNLPWYSLPTILESFSEDVVPSGYLVPNASCSGLTQLVTIGASAPTAQESWVADLRRHSGYSRLNYNHYQIHVFSQGLQWHQDSPFWKAKTDAKQGFWYMILEFFVFLFDNSLPPDCLLLWWHHLWFEPVWRLLRRAVWRPVRQHQRHWRPRSRGGFWSGNRDEHSNEETETDPQETCAGKSIEESPPPDHPEPQEGEGKREGGGEKVAFIHVLPCPHLHYLHPLHPPTFALHPPVLHLHTPLTRIKTPPLPILCFSHLLLPGPTGYGPTNLKQSLVWLKLSRQKEEKEEKKKILWPYL